MPTKGTTADYRPIPRDFDEVFVRVGWSGVCDHYRAGWAKVRKWISQANHRRALDGLCMLQTARSAFVRRHGADNSPKRIGQGGGKRRRYVAGRTLRTLTWTSDAPRFWDVGMVDAALCGRPKRLASVTNEQVEG